MLKFFPRPTVIEIQDHEIREHVPKHRLPATIPLHILEQFSTGSGEIEAELTSRRDACPMESSKFGAEWLGVRQLRAHVFEIEDEEVSDGRRAVEFAPRVWFWDEGRHDFTQLDHGSEFARHHCPTTVSSHCTLGRERLAMGD